MELIDIGEMFMPSRFKGIFTIDQTIGYAYQKIEEYLNQDSSKGYKVTIEDRANGFAVFRVYSWNYMKHHGESINITWFREPADVQATKIAEAVEKEMANNPLQSLTIEQIDQKFVSHKEFEKRFTDEIEAVKKEYDLSDELVSTVVEVYQDTVTEKVAEQLAIDVDPSAVAERAIEISAGAFDAKKVNGCIEATKLISQYVGLDPRQLEVMFGI